MLHLPLQAAAAAAGGAVAPLEACVAAPFLKGRRTVRMDGRTGRTHGPDGRLSPIGAHRHRSRAHRLISDGGAQGKGGVLRGVERRDRDGYGAS